MTFISRKLTIFIMVGVVSLSLCLVGYAQLNQHRYFGFIARNYFSDKGAVRLCYAIENNDLEEIKRLVKKEGVNVNAKGKHNATPLLWAFLGGKPERFKLLLELGADPNVILTGDVGKWQLFEKGGSVTYFAAKSKFEKHFLLVMKHGGDHRLKDYREETPLITVINGKGKNKRERIQVLIDAGADVNYLSLKSGWTPLSASVGYARRFDLTVMLLEKNADPKIYSSSGANLMHTVIWTKDYVDDLIGSKSQADYAKLVKWLEDHGEDFEQAREEIRLWKGGLNFVENSEDSIKYAALKIEGKKRYAKTVQMMKEKLAKEKMERKQ